MNHNHMIYYLGSITVLIIITGIYRKTYVPNVQKNPKNVPNGISVYVFVNV